MKLFKAAAVVACALALAGCAGLSALTGKSELPSQVLNNLEACKRIYTGATSPVPSMSFHIECEPAKPAAPAQ